MAYAFGWRPSLYDGRDRVYTATYQALEGLPARVDLFTPALPTPFNPCLNQGRKGACGPFSSIEDLIFAGLRQDGLAAMKKPSALFIYYNTRLVMGTAEGDPSKYLNVDSGVDNRAMMKALAQYGWCDDDLLPYSDDDVAFTRKPPQACYDQAAGRKIQEYLSVPQTLDQMKACVAGGDTFIFGFAVYESMLTPQVAKTGIIPLPNPRRDRIAGGHDILVGGFDDERQLFKARNHWYESPGVPWGDDGYAYVPYAYATNPKMAGDLWTVRHSYLPGPVPDPIPPQPTPTPAPSSKTYSFSMASGGAVSMGVITLTPVP